MNNVETKLIHGIKHAMESKRWTQKKLSQATDIPYRSIQNYLSGTTRMPATAYVQICDVLGIDNQYVLEGNFELHHMILWDALWDVIGDGLLDVKLLPATFGTSGDMTDHNQKQNNASTLARKLSISYDKHRQQRLENPDLIGSSKTTSERLK